MKNRALIVIPARMASTRFPGKPLALIRGVAMLQRVWRIAKAVRSADEVVIATDDLGLKTFAERFGAKVLMTSPECPTGTDRVAEVSRQLDQEYEIYFSFQGDAVLTPPWIIEAVLDEMLSDANVALATPAVRLQGEALAQFIEGKKRGSSSGTCVVFDRKRNALYFSKALIPYCRKETPIFRHIGLYGYRAETLQKLGSLPEGLLERAEGLEQLRALENGIPIQVVEVDYRGRTHGSVDLPEDVSFVESIIEQQGELV